MAVDRYFFDRDLRYCFTERHLSHGLTLAELRERYGRRRLILFADGSGFFDAYTGQPHEWLEQLRHWGTPALFAPAVPGHWRNPEQRLLALGFRLFSADPAGVAGFADSWEVTVPRTLGAAGAAARLPTTLSDLPRRWLSPEAPDPDTQVALIDDLRGYLGEDGLLWLAACAVYPELHWPLTLELGRRLELPGFLALLVRVSALPWFRHGRMPDWLREVLLDALGEREQELRAMGHGRGPTGTAGRDRFDAEVCGTRPNRRSDRTDGGVAAVCLPGFAGRAPIRTCGKAQTASGSGLA